MNKLKSTVAALALSTLVLSLCPASAFADKGGEHGSGNGGSSGSGSSGSSGSSDNHAGNPTHEAGEAGDDKGRLNNDDGGQRKGTASDHAFDGGWRERVRAGQYELFDPQGRLVIRREPNRNDFKRFE